MLKGFEDRRPRSLGMRTVTGSSTAVQKGQQHDRRETLLEFDQTWTMAHDLWKITYIQDGDRGGASHHGSWLSGMSSMASNTYDGQQSG
jgi:hypothetical protein